MSAHITADNEEKASLTRLVKIEKLNKLNIEVVAKFPVVLFRRVPVSPCETQVRLEVVILRLSGAHENKFVEWEASRCLRYRRPNKFVCREPEGVFHCTNRSSWVAAMTAIPNIRWDATLA